MRLVKTSPNARRGDEAISVPIDRSRNNAVGFVLTKPQRGCGSFLVNFPFFCFADTSVYLWHKKSKISSKILAAHARNLCQHSLIVILIGYASGVLHKILFNFDFVIAFYIFNLTLVFIDTALYFRNYRITKKAQN